MVVSDNIFHVTIFLKLVECTTQLPTPEWLLDDLLVVSMVFIIHWGQKMYYNLLQTACSLLVICKSPQFGEGFFFIYIIIPLSP